MAAWIRRSPKMSRLLGGRRSPPQLPGDDSSSSDGGASSCCGDSLLSGLDDLDANSECEYGPLGVDPPVQLRHPSSADLNTPRIDSYRFSMANLEDTQDVDLDAILGELCALETQCDEAIAEGAATRLGNKRTSAPSNAHTTNLDSPSADHVTIRSHVRSNSDGQRQNPSERDYICKNGSVRTDSPDNDSAFSDNVSMLSSESSASSGGSGGGGQINANLAPSPTQVDAAKAEKIRIALEKMREAAVQKLFIKVFTSDGSAKSLLVDEKMTVGYVTRLLADKNHVSLEPKWAVLEHLPDLHMERVYEDHELLVDNLMMWTRDSKNKLFFLDRSEERTRLFMQPELFLLGRQEVTDFDDHARSMLLEEFFSSTGVGVPEVEGVLSIKSESKKGWKRHHCVLRASGLYYYPKDKTKASSRDLVCLATFDVNQVYYGVGWRKKHKAPTDFCFAIKHPKLQQPKSAKHIKFLCADDAETLHRWVVGIRVAKYGRQLQENYRALSEELAQDELDRLAKARSCSVASIQVAMTSPPGVPSSGASSSSSSGCLSDAGRSSSTEQDTDVRSSGGFECEFPSGTIKRKPSAIPSLPLTSTTRQIIENGDDDCNSGGTLTRRLSRRRSTMTDADGSSIGSNSSNSSTLKRHTTYSSARSPSHMSPAPPSPAPLSPAVHTPTPISPSAVYSPASQSSIPNSPVLQFNSPARQSPLSAQSPGQSSPENETDTHDFESLPLPPLSIAPELSQSTLSLDSLPPPPPPCDFPYNPELSDSCLSLSSLPPPPSPPPVISKVSFNLQSRLEDSQNMEEVQYDLPKNVPQYDSMPSLPPEMPELPLHPSLQGKPLSVLRNSREKMFQTVLNSKKLINLNDDSKLARKTAPVTHKKKISFKLPSPSDEIPPCRSPPVLNGEMPPPLLARKPLPPRRSEHTRLSCGSLPAPKPDFLKDLQKVMQRKWQVAQKCKQDTTTTPHEVLGFRDPPPQIADYRETNVSNWVQEHYGASPDEMDNVYENVLARLPNPHCDSRTMERYTVQCTRMPSAPVSLQASHSAIALAAAKKRPPPPPPKRSETTQLTTCAQQRQY